MTRIQRTPPRPAPDVRTDAIPVAPTGSTAADRLVLRAAVVAAVADVVLMGVIGDVVPPLAIFVVLTLGAAATLRRRPAARTTTLAVIALVANLGGLPFWTQDLFHPAETVAFLWAVLSAGGRFVAIVGAVMARRDVADRTIGTIRAGAIGLVAVAIVATVVARAALTTDELLAGDVEATVEDTAFPEAVTVDQGDVLFLDNLDPYRHTFTVEGADLDVALPGGVARRVAVDLPPGEYTVVCAVPGHESMRTTLEVQ